VSELTPTEAFEYLRSCAAELNSQAAEIVRRILNNEISELPEGTPSISDLAYFATEAAGQLLEAATTLENLS
jgi:hypothetical protein